MKGELAFLKTYKGMHMLADSIVGPNQPGGMFAIFSIRVISLTALASQAWGAVPQITQITIKHNIIVNVEFRNSMTLSVTL